MRGRRRVAVLWRGELAVVRARPDAALRHSAVIDELLAAGFEVDAREFRDEEAERVLAALAGCSAALVWVDPVSDGVDRGVLDRLLREAAARGTTIYTHPDVTAKMGTKDVLFDTRELSWSLDTDRYESRDEFLERFPLRMREGLPRVLKPQRGNGGVGVWKVTPTTKPGGVRVVRVQHAAPRDGSTEDVPLDEFMRRMTPYLRDGGHLIDQEFAPRVAEGMVRAYLVKQTIVGFARQHPGMGAPSPGSTADKVFGLPSAKEMREPDDEELAPLRQRLESEWVPGLQSLVGVSNGELPLLWDADFLLGPEDSSGRDTYVLCEINVSCVSPFPPATPRRLVAALAAQLDAS